eukprot:TRINITY_DN65715_c3_g13_i1.p1 TRINITY_DN65715_c3_g13~~TRINITY_DN65715_c3_g13_i1.p1  ORF type:complete len:586 (+),score=214.65 TRINITY_DN65715_c3_g13_i1:22-1779(+)
MLRVNMEVERTTFPCAPHLTSTTSLRPSARPAIVSTIDQKGNKRGCACFACCKVVDTVSRLLHADARHGVESERPLPVSDVAQPHPASCPWARRACVGDTPGTQIMQLTPPLADTKQKTKSQTVRIKLRGVDVTKFFVLWEFRTTAAFKRQGSLYKDQAATCGASWHVYGRVRNQTVQVITHVYAVDRETREPVGVKRYIHLRVMRREDNNELFPVVSLCPQPSIDFVVETCLRFLSSDGPHNDLYDRDLPSFPAFNINAVQLAGMLPQVQTRSFDGLQEGNSLNDRGAHSVFLQWDRADRKYLLLDRTALKSFRSAKAMYEASRKAVMRTMSVTESRSQYMALVHARQQLGKALESIMLFRCELPYEDVASIKRELPDLLRKVRALHQQVYSLMLRPNNDPKEGSVLGKRTRNQSASSSDDDDEDRKSGDDDDDDEDEYDDDDDDRIDYGDDEEEDDDADDDDDHRVKRRRTRSNSVASDDNDTIHGMIMGELESAPSTLFSCSAAATPRGNDTAQQTPEPLPLSRERSDRVCDHMPSSDSSLNERAAIVDTVLDWPPRTASMLSPTGSVSDSSNTSDSTLDYY